MLTRLTTTLNPLRKTVWELYSIKLNYKLQYRKRFFSSPWQTQSVLIVLWTNAWVMHTDYHGFVESSNLPVLQSFNGWNRPRSVLGYNQMFCEWWPGAEIKKTDRCVLSQQFHQALGNMFCYSLSKSSVCSVDVSDTRASDELTYQM